MIDYLDMKIRRILFIMAFLVILPSIVQAQIKFISNKKEDMRLIGDSIILNAKRNYIFKSETVENRYSYSLNYENTENKDDILSVNIQVYYRNENPEFEIEQIPEFNFSYVEGRYLDLFPFWKKYINEDEDIEKLSQKKHTYLFKYNKRFIFSKSSEIWKLSMKDIIK